MAVLSVYEKRKLREQQQAAPVGVSPVVPVVTVAPVVVKSADPYFANHVSKIKFGPQALKDWPLLAMAWASDYER